jgi:hypothetical protein
MDTKTFQDMVLYVKKLKPRVPSLLWSRRAEWARASGDFL